MTKTVCLVLDTRAARESAAPRHPSSSAIKGARTKRHASGTTTAKASETRTGRTTVAGAISTSPPPPPRLDMIWTMTRPTTSSIMAAVLRTLPSRVDARPLVLSTVKVVPRLVEHRAAPAAKHCRYDAPAAGTNAKDRAMGAAMPVSATHADSSRLAFMVEREVERPPVFSESVYLHAIPSNGNKCQKI